MSIAHPDPHPNRESWLNDVAGRLRPAFAQMGAPLPDRLRIAIGFPSTGRRAKATGECWDSAASADASLRDPRPSRPRRGRGCPCPARRRGPRP